MRMTSARMHERIVPILAAVLLVSGTPTSSPFKFKIGSNWEEKAQFLAAYMATAYMYRKDAVPMGIHWINSSADIDLCELRRDGVVALLVSNGCAATAALARKAREARLPFLAVLNRGCSRQWVLREAYGNESVAGEQPEEQPEDDPQEIEEPTGTLLVPYYEEFDTRVVLAKMEAMRVNRALVVYDDVFATYAMDTFRRQTERLNLTLAFVPLEANRTRVLEAINHTLRRMSRKNTFYTSFVMLVFANFTLAERLEAELVTHIGLNPNMRLLLFYNGWDKSLGRWYYQHEITSTFEKQIYVITRAHIGDTRNIMMTASANWGSHDHVFTMPDISTLVFIHYVILYTSHHARNLAKSTACGTPMDDVLEGMKQNITTEVKRLSVHRSTARYRMFFLAPVTSKEYRLKLIENWRLNNASLERTVLLDEVDAYLRNRTINVAILEFPPYAIYHKEQGGSITCNGTFLHFINYLQEIFGFNVSYQLAENATSLGYKLTQSNWNGLLGNLNKRETDLVSFTDITEERMHAFSLTDSIMSHPVAMLLQTPKILSRKMLFVQPFTTQVWALLLISIPVVSVALWLVYNWSPEEAPRRRKGRGLSELHNCAWYAYGALLQQGGVHLPVGTSSRLVMCAWWLYVVIVMAYYSSNLIAFLTVPEPQWVVSSFREAVAREDIHVYIPHGTGLHQEIMKSSNEHFIRLRRRLGVTATAVPDLRTIVDRVATGKAILLADKQLLEALVIADYKSQQKRRCRVAIFNDDIMLITIGISARRGSPFVQALNRHFYLLRTSGNLRFLLKNHREKPRECFRNYGEDTRGLSKPIGLSEMESAFLLLLLGTAISLMTVPVEFVAHWARSRRRARMLMPSGTTSGHDNGWWIPDDNKTRPFISLRHGWKRADEAVWTTVGPGGHVISDCYPAFGQFGRRPLYVNQAPPFPFYQPCWGGTAAAEEPAQGKRRGHVVMVGNWP